MLAFFLRSKLAHELPFHTDESTQAWILQQGIKEGYIRYDPLHHHGPAPIYLRKLFLGLNPQPHWQEWSEPLLRRAGIFCSILTLGALFLFLASYSLLAAIITAFLFAAHPYLIYYHSQAIHEPIFVFFGIFFLILLQAWRENQSPHLAILSGLFAGLFQSSKETWILLPATAFLAWLITGSLRTYLRLFFRSPHAKFFWGTAIITSLLFYSGFFHDFRGVPSSWSTFWSYETEQGHNKAWSWYLEQLFGLRPFTPSLFIASLIWIIPWLPIKNKIKVPTWICEWKWLSLFQLIIYSMISYKTPWLLLLAWSFILPATGWKLAALLQSTIPYKLGGTSLLLLLVITFYQMRWTTILAPTYPYSYSATSAEIEKITSFVDSHQSMLSREIRIAVQGESYWPIPWLLRKYNSVGFFQNEPPDGFDLILSVEPQLNPDSTTKSWELRENIHVKVK